MDQLFTKSIKVTSILCAFIYLLFLVIYAIIGIDGLGSIFHFNPDRLEFVEITRAQPIKYSIVPRERVYYLLAGAILMIIISVFIFCKAHHLSLCIKNAAVFFTQYCSDTFKEIKGSKVKYLLLIPLGACIYYAYTVPITHDEATTYIHYVMCSIPNTMFGYTMPNNHILFSLIEHIFIKIPVLDLLFKFRLPSIIIALLTWIILYRFAKKYANDNTAITIVAIVSTTYMILQYSFFARGYSFVILFCVLCLYAACNIIYNNNRLRDWTIFTVSGILGFYAMPSFLYPFFTINIFILCLNRKNITKQIKFNLYTVIGVILLYLPILIIMGYQSLAGNQFVKPLDRIYVISQLFSFFNLGLHKIFAISPYILIPVFTGAVIYSISRKRRKLTTLWLVCLVSPFIILTAHSVIPFHRTFVYYGFLLVFLTALSFKDLIKMIPLKILIVLLIGVQAGQIYQFHLRLNPLTKYYAEHEDVIEKVLVNNKSYFTNDLYLYPNLLFEIDRHNINSTVDKSFVRTSADSLERYDVVLLLSALDETRKRKPKYSIIDFRDEPINIYY